MRALRPACNPLVTAGVANNRTGMCLIDEAVVQLVKNTRVKSRTILKNHSTGLVPLSQQVGSYDQIMLSDELPPTNTTYLWGAERPVANPGPVSENVRLAYAPQAQKVPAHLRNLLPVAQGVLAEGIRAQNVLDYHRNFPPQAQNVPAHHGNYLPPAQGVPSQKVPDHHGNYPSPR